MIMSNPNPYMSRLLASKRCTPLTPEQEIVFLARFRAGDARARERLILANLKFVASVARRYLTFGLPFEDLMQEGIMGLDKAIHKYNPASNNRLISYAVWWIRQKMLSAILTQSRSYAFPQRLVEISSQMDRARRWLEQSLGRMATLAEIALEMKTTVDQLEGAIAILHPADSLDSPIGADEGSATHLDALEAQDNTEAETVLRQAQQNIKALLAHLPAVDREILARVAGLQNDLPETLEMIARDLNLSRERIRQRRDKAHAKLRPWALKMKLYTPTLKEGK